MTKSGGSGSVDYSRRGRSEADELEQKAIKADYAGDRDGALRLYEEAIKRFHGALAVPCSLSDAEQDHCRRHQADCSRRIKELRGGVPTAGQAHQQQTSTRPSGNPAPTAGRTVSNPSRAPPPPSQPRQGQKDEQPADDTFGGAILSSRPEVQWSDVAGLDEAKRVLQQVVVMPMKCPQLYVGIDPWRGILLYGPPGTGKGMLAKAVACAAGDATFFSLTAADLVSKWLGESEKLIRQLFEMAREKKPSVIFIDEVDCLFSERGEGQHEAMHRVKTQFMAQLDGVGKSMDQILLLAATNCPWSLDAAFIRRFQRRVYIPLPDANARRALFKVHLRNVQHQLSDADIEELVRLTDGFSGSDIEVLKKAAVMAPVARLQQAEYWAIYRGTGQTEMQVRRATPDEEAAARRGEGPNYIFRKTIMEMSTEEAHAIKPEQAGMEDFREALQSTRASVSGPVLAKFDAWTQQFGLAGS